MWSNKYYYLNIYKNETLECEVSTQLLREFINGIPELVQKGNFAFENRYPFPFTKVLLIKANSLDSWNDKDTDEHRTNLITIVCAKGAGIDFFELKRVFVQIASFLNWTLVEEYTVNDDENFEIWEPKDK